MASEWFIGSAVVRGVDVPYTEDPTLFCPPSKKDSFVLVSEESILSGENTSISNYLGLYQVADNRLRGPIADIHLSDIQSEVLALELLSKVPKLSKTFLKTMSEFLKTRRGV